MGDDSPQGCGRGGAGQGSDPATERGRGKKKKSIKNQLTELKADFAQLRLYSLRCAAVVIVMERC